MSATAWEDATYLESHARLCPRKGKTNAQPDQAQCPFLSPLAREAGIGKSPPIGIKIGGIPSP